VLTELVATHHIESHSDIYQEAAISKAIEALEEKS